MNVQIIDSYLGPQTSATHKSSNEDGLQKNKQNTINTVVGFTNSLQSWDLQSDFDYDTSMQLTVCTYLIY